jgi:hypothetical protein
MSRIQYEITADTAQVAEAVNLFEFVGGNTSDALRIAINKTAPKVKTLASTAIRAQVKLTASYVRDRLIVTKATRSRLSAVITTPSRGTLMTRYSTDPTVALGVDRLNWISPPPIPKSGIRIKIKTNGSTKGAPSFDGNKPFYMVLKNSHALGIVARLDTPGKRGGRFKVFNSPSLSQVFNTVRGDVLPTASSEYQAQLLDAMRYLLVKKYPPEAVV